MAIGKPSYKRSVRLRELYIQEISKALPSLKDPGLKSGFLTITDLELSKDMKTARVYYSLLGSARDREMAQKALERSVHFIRSQVLAKLRMKIIPRLIFSYDDTAAEAQKIETVLNKIKAEESGEQGPEENQASEQLDSLATRRPPRRRRRRQ